MLIWQHGYNFLFKINCYKYFKQTYFKLREITNSIVLVKPPHLYIIIYVFTKSVFLLLDVELSLLLSMTEHPYHKLTLILYKHFSGWGWQGGLQCSICRPQDVPDLQKYVLDLAGPHNTFSLNWQTSIKSMYNGWQHSYNSPDSCISDFEEIFRGSIFWGKIMCSNFLVYHNFNFNIELPRLKKLMQRNIHFNVLINFIISPF